LGAGLEQLEREDSGVFFVPHSRRRYNVLPHCKVWTYKNPFDFEKEERENEKK
jgi:hypothetical protein